MEPAASPESYVYNGWNLHRDGDGQGRVRQDGDGERDNHSFGFRIGSLTVNAGSNISTYSGFHRHVRGIGVRGHCAL